MNFFDNLIESKLLSVHTSYIGRVLSVSEDLTTARILPLGKTREYGKEAKSQTPLSNVPVLHSARWKLEKKKLRFVIDLKVEKGEEYVEEVTPTYKEYELLLPKDLEAGDLVLCVCCERDINAARNGGNVVPPVGHHSMSSSVVVGIL